MTEAMLFTTPVIKSCTVTRSRGETHAGSETAGVAVEARGVKGLSHSALPCVAMAGGDAGVLLSLLSLYGDMVVDIRNDASCLG